MYNNPQNQSANQPGIRPQRPPRQNPSFPNGQQPRPIYKLPPQQFPQQQFQPNQPNQPNQYQANFQPPQQQFQAAPRPTQYQQPLQGQQIGFQPKSPFPNQQYQQPVQGQAQGQGMEEYISEFQSSATGQIGMQLGTQALSTAKQHLSSNVGRFFNIVQWRYYFNVSNSYVLNKIQVLLFPFMHKGWARIVEQMDDNGQVGAYAAPRSDLNAPDLYIPLMSIVTYIIIVGVLSGLNTTASVTNTFSPEILGITASKGSVMIGLEVLCIKLGNYFMNITADVSFMDLISYTGYQFIPICIVLMTNFAFGSWTKFFVFLYCFTAFGFFTLRSLRNVVLPEIGQSNVTNEVPGGERKQRVFYLVIIVLVETIIAWFFMV